MCNDHASYLQLQVYIQACNDVTTVRQTPSSTAETTETADWHCRVHRERPRYKLHVSMPRRNNSQEPEYLTLTSFQRERVKHLNKRCGRHTETGLQTGYTDCPQTSSSKVKCSAQLNSQLSKTASLNSVSRG